jgi:CRISPR-associated protein Csa1
MYYLNEVEQKYLTLNLRPHIRENPVPEELRGWNWHYPPLKPYYDIKLPMYLICSRYCETSRDVYLSKVERIEGKENYFIRAGKITHYAVSSAINEAKKLNFRERLNSKESYGGEFELAKLAWEYTMTSCRANYLKHRAEQEYASEEDVILTSIPFLVEHRMDGSLLGCSGLISVDCFDYLHNIIFDLKVSNPRDLRLYTTGYALILESLYEIPVDLGCTVFVREKNGKIIVSRDLHFIDANLRSLWIEERDRKSGLVYDERDPGKARNCNPYCIFRNYCL